MLAVPYLLAASYLAPKIGVGLFAAASITGTLGGGVLLDQLGLFGAAVRTIDAVRVLGIALLIAGVVLVRGFR
jgi:transporter family-2 protein